MQGHLGIGTAFIYALLGYLVVFIGLVLLMLVVRTMGKVMVARMKKAAPAVSTAPAAVPAAAAAPKKLAPGTIAPASAADTNSEYSVYYFAAYKEGKRVIEIDPFNQICYINGVDHMADVRRALGKA